MLPHGNKEYEFLLKWLIRRVQVGIALELIISMELNKTPILIEPIICHCLAPEARFGLKGCYRWAIPVLMCGLLIRNDE